MFQRWGQAKEIFDAHLSADATDPVNVDSQAKKVAEKQLSAPTPTMFDAAQHQVTMIASSHRLTCVCVSGLVTLCMCVGTFGCFSAGEMLQYLNIFLFQSSLYTCVYCICCVFVVVFSPYFIGITFVSFNSCY